MVPGLTVTSSWLVTSSPSALRMTSLSAVAVTPEVTSVAEAVEAASATMWPSGSGLTVTVAPWAWPS